MNKKNVDFFWKASVVVLLVFMCVQSGILYFVLVGARKTGESTIVPVLEEEDVEIKPRMNEASKDSVDSRNIPKKSLGNSNTPPSTSRCTQVPSSNSPAIGNMLPPLPKINNNSNNQSTMPNNALSSGINSLSISSNPSSSTSNVGLMQAMLNDPFFSDDSFFGDIHAEFAQMQELMDTMFSNTPSGFTAHGNSGLTNLSISLKSPEIKDDGKNYILELKLPGLDKSAIKAEVNGNVLTLSATQKEEIRNSGQYGSSFSSSYSTFQNSFSLPGKVDSGKIKFNYKDDVLKVFLPKV